jgi:hypothetical protein
MSVEAYRLALQHFQSDRLRRDHADLASEPQYGPIGEFFFEELYGPRDFASRDAQARKLGQFVHLAPGLNIGDVQQVLSLLELSNRLDDQVAIQLVALNAPVTFDEPTYERAYRMADNYEDRVVQLELVSASLYNVYKMARRPMIKIVLDRTERLANTVGMGDIHRFLRTGYDAIQPVQDIHRFVETIGTRERDRLDRIHER